MELPFRLETDLERKIAADPAWQKGVVWGKPRAGHQEGAIMYHIADIFANIERQHVSAEERRDLRLIALVHDTFKYRVNEQIPRVGSNHHAHRARRFAEHYIADQHVLEIIERHDEAYHCWRAGVHRGKWKQAEEWLDRLLLRLGSAWLLYVRFFFADSMTESKDQAPVIWFEQHLERKGLVVPDLSPETEE